MANFKDPYLEALLNRKPDLQQYYSGGPNQFASSVDQPAPPAAYNTLMQKPKITPSQVTNPDNPGMTPGVTQDAEEELAGLEPVSSSGSTFVAGKDIPMLKKFLGIAPEQEFSAANMPTMQRQQAAIDQLQQQADIAKQIPSRPDLSGALSFADYLAKGEGTLAKNYQKPTTPEELVAMKAKLQDMVAKGQGEMTDAQLKALGALARPDNSAANSLYRAQLLALRKQQMGMNALNKAGQAYQKEVGPVEFQLQAAKRSLDIVNEVRDPKKFSDALIANPQLANDLTATLAAMASGKSPTVYGMSHQEFKSYQAEWNKLAAYINGGSPVVITEKQLIQLKKDIQAFQKSYAQLHKTKVEQLKQTQPSMVHDAINNKANIFMGDVGPKNTSDMTIEQKIARKKELEARLGKK